jgi:hypothetical protein
VAEVRATGCLRDGKTTLTTPATSVRLTHEMTTFGVVSGRKVVISCAK